MKSTLGKIWALPTTLIFGLPLGILGLCLAPRKSRIRLAHNAICFYSCPLLKGGNLALTLGNVILFQQNSDCFWGIDIGAHEQQHTYQAEVLGFLYVPLHIICLLFFGRYKKNPLERGPFSTPPRPW